MGYIQKKVKREVEDVVDVITCDQCKEEIGDFPTLSRVAYDQTPDKIFQLILPAISMRGDKEHLPNIVNNSKTLCSPKCVVDFIKEIGTPKGG